MWPWTLIKVMVMKLWGFFGGSTGVLAAANGGTGINNSTNTLTLGRSQVFTAPTTADATADVIIGASAISQKPLVLQGKNGQTANIQEWQDSTGDIFAAVNSANRNLLQANGWQEWHTSGFTTATRSLLIGSGAGIGGIRMASDYQVKFSSAAAGANDAFTVDTGLARSAAGVVKVTDGSSGTGGLVVGTLASVPATVQDISTGNTITLPTVFTKRLTATAGAATGVIMTAGTSDGQMLCLFNVHATNAITFAAAGTSNIADGVSTVIAALTGVTLVWDATSSRWYHQK